MTFLTAPDGTRLRYEIEGDGPALVLHLLSGCDSELWRAAGYLEPLAAAYRCILFDHRGHGRSDKPRGAEANHLDRYVADVVALLDHLDIERAAFWGYSSGIDVRLKLSHEQPSRIWALVASGAMGQATPAELREIVAMRVPEFREHGWEKLLARFGDGEPEPVPGWMKERIRATDVQQVIDLFEGLPDRGWDAWEILSSVGVPTLLLVGEIEAPSGPDREGGGPDAPWIQVPRGGPGTYQRVSQQCGHSAGGDGLPRGACRLKVLPTCARCHRPRRVGMTSSLEQGAFKFGPNVHHPAIAMAGQWQ